MNAFEKDISCDIRYDKTFYVVQANELVRSKQDDLTLLEAKLIRLAIAQIVREDSELQTYSCAIVELAKFLGISPDNIYRDVQILSSNLMKKSIYIKDTAQTNRRVNLNYKIFHWIDYVEYINGIITFKLSDSLKPYLIGLDQLFTQCGYGEYVNLPTNNSIRLFELLTSYRNMALNPTPSHNYTDIPIREDELIFTVDWLKEFFNCQDKYANTSDFIRRIIDPSTKDINTDTAMRVSYRTAKKGRKIYYIIFKFNEWTEKDCLEFEKKYSEEFESKRYS